MQSTSAPPVITFTFTNNIGNAPVYIAIAGEEINTQVNDASTYGYLAPQMTDGSPDFTKPWQFQTFGLLTDVTPYRLFSASSPAGATQTVIIPNDPDERLDAMRTVFSVNSQPIIPINGGQASFPAPGNSGDLNNKINYDFVEFTERSSPHNDGILFINSTQVDQVGIPFTMQMNPANAVKPSGVGITVSGPQLFSKYSSYISSQLKTKADATAAKAFRSLSTPYRLLNPKDAITNPPATADPSTFGSYFDSALTTFFNKYKPSQKKQRSDRWLEIARFVA